MKKIVSVIVLFVAIAYGFSSCGDKTKPEGMQVPTVINGPLGEYYDVVSVDVRPFNEEEINKMQEEEYGKEKLEKNNYYKIIVEVKKNAKAFNFDPSKIEYSSYISDYETDKFSVAGVVNSSEGEELESFSFGRKGGVESLLMTCSKEGATKKISAEFDIKKEEDKGDKAIEITSILKSTAQDLEQIKEGVKMLKDLQGAPKEESLFEDNNQEEEEL